jgi:hypothetical protein
MTSGQGSDDAVFVGGPNDGATFASDDAAVVEVRLDGLLHRYIRTTQRREGSGGSDPVVYNYDGVIDPSGATPGVETERTTGD